MHLDGSESELLKKWIIRKLESISDADSDVLADYVLALVKTDEPEAVAKANCIDNLKDFLVDNAESFVDDVFHTIAAKAYNPVKPPHKPTAPVYQPRKRLSYGPPRLPNESRKRSYHDWDGETDETEQTPPFSSERPIKQPRRGGRGAGFHLSDGRSAHAPTHGHSASAYQQQAQLPPMPQMPMPPPGMPPFDPNNPLAALMAMQQVLGLVPGIPSAGSPQNAYGFSPARTGQRCRDYDNQGFCTRGVSCPYEHGENPYVIPIENEEYDPNNATLPIFMSTGVGHHETPPNAGRGSAGRGRGRRGGRVGGKRAEFSHVGPNHDRSNTSIVVEQIPEDKVDEETVRNFFSQFGNVEGITMQPYKRLAVVQYDNHNAARAAYDSPKVVFDNRFVKVYWYKPETLPTLRNGNAADSSGGKGKTEDVRMEQAEEQLDIKEIAKRQEEAQRKHDEVKQQREEAETRKRELDEKLSTMALERRKLEELLAKKIGQPEPEDPQESDRTKALKAQLAKLEAEAKSLGIDPDTESIGSGYGAYYQTYRSRGGYRGRPRGRGGYYGASRGTASARGGAVMRLDNRPKTIMVTFTNGSSYEDNEEAIRQYMLLADMDSATLSKHPERGDTALVAFQQRFEGENFMNAVNNNRVPNLVNAELSWYTSNKSPPAVNDAHDQDVKMENAATVENGNRVEANNESGNDEATQDDDDLDRWGG